MTPWRNSNAATTSVAAPTLPARSCTTDEDVRRYEHRPLPARPSSTPGDILAAAGLEAPNSLSFWDALIVVAAIRSGVERILSEDLQHDRTIGGGGVAS